ncbi:FecR domain-containing protein [Comamonas sp. AG1104]|uniref:FecR family protein n=1 Tax=Comamonas sp. AG1104 TaxID=2183900 RepID=UPI000E0B436C|nr:FecR domain-containing protein [Comamonas sp. AG1104]RDI06599.1 FecR family protein [Comamonas sp. AG1104]
MTPSLPPTANGNPAREDALDWFVRRRDQGLSAQDEHAFQAWLNAASLNRAAFDHWQAEWQSFDAIPQDMKALLQRNLAYDQAMEAASGAAREAVQAGKSRQDHAEAESNTETIVRTGPTRRRILMPALSMAAVATVVTSTGGLAWKHWQAQPTFVQSLASKRGQQLEATMPDGSRLRLDAATRLEVAYYRNRREVTLLEGQAMFEVATNPTLPFDVLAGPVHVTVVGTRFAVRYTPSLPGEAGVHVAVEEGKVRVAQMRTSGHVVMLSAGQQVTSDRDGVLASVSSIAPADVAPWQSQRVRFDSQRLDVALAELGRYVDVPLVIHDPSVAALPITGVFNPTDLSTFQRVLPASLPVRLKAVGQGTWEIVMR